MVLLKFFVHIDQVGHRVSFLLLCRCSLLLSLLLLLVLLGFGDLLLVGLKAGTEQRCRVLLHLGRRHVDIAAVGDHVLHLLFLLRTGDRQPVAGSQVIAQPFGRLKGLVTAKVMAAVSRGTGTDSASAGRRSTLLEIDRRMSHLHVLRQVVLHGESLVTTENRTGEKSSVQVPLDVLFKQNFVVKRHRAHGARKISVLMGHVEYEVRFLNEPFVALWTRKAKVRTVNFQVVLEKRLGLETLVRTLRAEKGFRRAVLRHQVQVQLGDLVEPPRALIAYVLLGFVVRFHVVVQVGHLSERATTICLNANVGSLSGVQSSMVVQVCDLSKCFATIDANVRTLICVNANMVPEIRLLRKTFLTVLADILLLGGVISYVVQQRSLSAESFVANRTTAFLSLQNFVVHSL